MVKSSVPLETSRKARRKEERNLKKTKKKREIASVSDDAEPSSVPRSSVNKNAGDRDEKTMPRPSKRQKPADPSQSAAPKAKKGKDKYSHLDSNIASALRTDDEEIAELEAKLGLGKDKDKSRLNKEYAQQEGYGNDFGNFLDNIDDMISRVLRPDDDEDHSDGDEQDYVPTLGGNMDKDQLLGGHSSESEDEEEVPMKGPSSAGLDSEASESEDRADSGNNDEDGESEQSGGSENDKDSDEESVDPDHDVSLTYQPTSGEDIYGKQVDGASGGTDTKKYVPPHLRKQQGPSNAGAKSDEERREALQGITRSLNGILNRLSDDTLVSVAQSIAKLYPRHPTSDLNECLWMNMRNVCVARAQVMTALIPMYVAAVSGVHFLRGDAAQLGEYLIEKAVLELWSELSSARSKTVVRELESGDIVSKEASNLCLVLCYLYNCGVLPCSLIYDVVRKLTEKFHEVDVELLLLVLSHSGRALRSDDPSALKEIVLLIQERSLEEPKKSSRVDYMLTAMIDLKNNKRRNQDSEYVEKTSKLRKLLGQIKSSAAMAAGGRSSDATLRLTLDDILNAEVKGRWWKVGASWVGNKAGALGDARSAPSAVVEHEQDEHLLKLAKKLRMNTDVRRSIFCIVMGSEDFEDAFEKLVRAGMLKNRTEKETVRVLMECCGNEKTYNKFYSHLSARLCEYQPQCKFSFQLAFWDYFKQFEEMKIRKSANLAKLLFHLVVVHHELKVNVVKAIDMSSSDEMPEAATIFVTIFLSSILEHYDTPAEVTELFQRGISRKKVAGDVLEGGVEDSLDMADEGEALCANLSLFFDQTLKSSPKYKKGSKFRANLKAAAKACDVDNFFG